MMRKYTHTHRKGREEVENILQNENYWDIKNDDDEKSF